MNKMQEKLSHIRMHTNKPQNNEERGKKGGSFTSRMVRRMSFGAPKNLPLIGPREAWRRLEEI